MSDRQKPKLSDLVNSFKKSIPSKEEMEKNEKNRYNMAGKNPNQFSNWYPSVLKSGAKVPKTLIFELEFNVIKAVLSENKKVLDRCKEMQELEKKVNAVFDEFKTDVLFIKNGLYSGKHSWKYSCCIKRGDNVANHIACIVYEWAIRSNDESNELIVREMIDVDPAFHAFDGNMPITEEYRLFSKDGETYAYQPYWPEDAIREPSCDDWKERLNKISMPSKELLEKMSKISSKVTKSLKGDWSVDFLIDKKGNTYLIDMATSERSYKSPDAKAIKQKETGN